MRKRRLKFYGHLNILTLNRLTNKIVENIQRIKTTTQLVKQVGANLDKAKLNPTEINDRNTYRHNT